jgi:predicted RNA-binding Zn-ribbon protein involved in translation (DUF1610 family)
MRREGMERWLGLGLLLLIAGLLAGILLALLDLGEQGIMVRFSGPILIGGSLPEEWRVALTMAEPVEVDAAGTMEANLRTALSVLPCPNCAGGQLVPVRWNPFSGGITWRCPNCGYEVP